MRDKDVPEFNELQLEAALAEELNRVAPRRDLWPSVQARAQRSAPRPRRRWLAPALGSVAVLGSFVLLALVSTVFMMPAFRGSDASDALSSSALDLWGSGSLTDGLSARSSRILWPATVNDAPYDATFFKHYGTNPFIDTEDDRLSTFAMDVDTASYTVARLFVMDGHLPDPDSVRVEEFINFFKQEYEPPATDAFAIHIDGAPSPFGGEKHWLMRVGLQGQVIPAANRKDASLIFVIDVSGSMERENRLGLVKKALALLVEQLRPTDDVGVVVYGSRGRVVLEPTSGENKETILEAISRLRLDGSTNAEEGLRLGYDMANQLVRPGRITRVILLSDGVANVGRTGLDSILEEVRRYADGDITLSTVGFGMENIMMCLWRGWPTQATVTMPTWTR